LLDACFQTVAAYFQDQGTSAIYLPIGIQAVALYQQAGTEVWCRIDPVHFHPTRQDSLLVDLSLADAAGHAIATVTGLRLQRVNQRRLLQSLQPDISNSFYTLTWRPKVLKTSAKPQPPETGKWLIFEEASPLGEALRASLGQSGDVCVQVKVGEAYAQLAPDQFVLNPAQREDFQRLFQTLGPGPYRGIIHLWGLETDAATALTPEFLDRAQVVSCGSVLHLIQSLSSFQKGAFPPLWLVTCQTQAVLPDPQPLTVTQSTLWGLGRVIALEHPELRCVRIDLEAGLEATPHPTVSLLIDELRQADGEDQIAYRRGQRYVARFAHSPDPVKAAANALEVPASQPVQLQASGSGLLDDLTLVPISRRSPGPGEVEIQVRATGLNFRDVLNALGMLKQYMAEMGLAGTDIPFGGECSGQITAVGEGVQHLQVGDAVIAALAIGSLSSYITVPADFVVPKPDRLTFEEAATISTAFLTAYYGLHHLAHLKPGERVLIHSAAGGVGQAAVQIAQWLGAEVYATASPPKWPVLTQMGVKGVMNSRTLDFVEEVKALTTGQGVDVVLNSLTGDFIPSSLSILAPQGRFVEIGKIGIWDSAQMASERPDVTYLPFDLLEVAQETPAFITRLLPSLMEKFHQTLFQPLPHEDFSLAQVVEAFRHMAQAKHVGKVVITHPVPSPSPSGSPTDRSIQAEATYLITGGLGALGLELAAWLVDQGARHLVLTSRRTANESAQAALAILESQGASVKTICVDISDAAEVTALLTQIQQGMPPLRGVFHAAGVLEDGLLQRQSWTQFSRVMAPKVQGSWLLHTCTQGLPLDFFVCFSSIAAVLGSPGQGNYAAANAFMDSLMHHRHALGLPGLSINWGPWATRGMAARLDSRSQSRWQAQGIEPLTPSQGLQALERLLHQPIAQQAVITLDWSKFLKHLPGKLPTHFLEAFQPTETTAAAEIPKSDLVQRLAALPAGERRQGLMEYLRSQIAKVLGLKNPQEIQPRQRLFDLGLDSLMAVELKNRLEKSLGQTIATTLLFDYPTLDALVDYLLQEVLVFETVHVADEPQSAVSSRLDSLLADLDGLSEHDIINLFVSQRSKP
jgi:NADPH:quinone reductase-like Zn-dependent oxidoreductase/NAD(P)-dependent dehydrogenase (short-subunit alcohol dehydrogenase family)/acyl carrier protein